jgi:hypothetical protein
MIFRVSNVDAGSKSRPVPAFYLHRHYTLTVPMQHNNEHSDRPERRPQVIVDALHTVVQGAAM